MRKLLILLLLLVGPGLLFAQSRGKQKKADQQTAAWRYEIENLGMVATAGNRVFKVWSYASDPRVATEQAKKNAVHGILFKGLADASRAKGCSPLVPGGESGHEAFFDAFFAQGGEYMKYVALTTSGEVAAEDVLRVSKKEYKIGVIVTVQYDNLRRRLEQEGIVEKLNSRF